MKFEKYEKVYAVTSLSNMKLLCKVMEYQEHTNMVLLELPCIIQGHKTHLIQANEVTKIKPKNEQPQQQQQPYRRSPESNPFRKLVAMIEKHSDHVQNGNNTNKASQQVQIQEPAKEPPRESKYQELLKRLSPSQRAILKNLSKQQQLDYLDMIL